VISTTWAAVRARRLARQHLLTGGNDIVEVSRSTCGIHAQVQAAAELSLSARAPAVTQQDVRNALWRDRTLVKAWTLRGTLHLHPADDLPLWFAAKRAVAGAPTELPEWRDPNGKVHAAVRANEREKLEAATWDALSAEPLLRDELVDEVVKRAGKKHEGRLRSGFAFFLGEAVQGPPQGNKITLVRPDRWLAAWPDVEEAEALRVVVRRFLYAYGPARPSDFRSWFGADVSFDDIDVEPVAVDGHQAFVLAGDTEFVDAPDSVRLLPEYDAYVMGFRERQQLVPDDVRALVAAHGRGKYEGPAGVRFVVVDGVTRGLWERKKRAKTVELTVTLAAKLTRPQQKALADEAARIGAYLGVEAVLTVG
jgi:Winged helix DNA-binding domain